MLNFNEYKKMLEEVETTTSSSISPVSTNQPKRKKVKIEEFEQKVKRMLGSTETVEGKPLNSCNLKNIQVGTTLKITTKQYEYTVKKTKENSLQVYDTNNQKVKSLLNKPIYLFVYKMVEGRNTGSMVIDLKIGVEYDFVYSYTNIAPLQKMVTNRQPIKKQTKQTSTPINNKSTNEQPTKPQLNSLNSDYDNFLFEKSDYTNYPNVIKDISGDVMIKKIVEIEPIYQN